MGSLAELAPKKSEPSRPTVALASAPEGLTSEQAAARLREVGPNAVAESAPRAVRTLLRKFWGLIPWMLESAIVLDLILGRWVEAAVITLLLVVNSLVGFMQERRAAMALALLRGRLTIDARVRRDGRWGILSAAQIVPGDVVRLRAGDIVPADMRLAEGRVLLDQSVLTGESLPVDHEAGSTAYSGSLVRRGEATGEVTATGVRTYFGKTTELTRVAEAPPRLERVIVEIAKYIAAFDVILALAVFAVAWLRSGSVFDVLPFVLMLLVASIPHVLPTMFIMTAALGSRALADRGILVTRLAAIEDAASMDVLLLDKTGTLTENHLAVRELAPRTPATSDDLLRLAVLACEEATQDPLDLAILEAARARGLPAALPARVAFVPFDPAIKRSEASVLENGVVVRIVKGEPATVAKLAGDSTPELAAEVARLSADGSRVLVVAKGSDVSLRVVGLVALGDPIRSDSAALIGALKARGVRVLLVTGDGEATARAVAARAGIEGTVAPMGTIHEGFDAASVMPFSIFAGVFPEDKFLLVQALQKAGHVVGMTGDGVNDAPALRQADVGIAVANATDVAKAAASLILTTPGLAGIEAAVDGSRRIYQRMKTFVLTMNTRKIGIPLFLALGVLAVGTFVLSPLLIVLLMLVMDVATMSVSMDQASPSELPDRWDIRPLMWTALGFATLLLALSALVFWLGTIFWGMGVGETQTLLFAWLLFAGSQAVLYVTRTRGFFWTKPHPGRSLHIATLVVILLVSFMAARGWLTAAIPLARVGAMLLLAMVYLVLADLLKVALGWVASRRGDRLPLRRQRLAAP